MFQTRIALRKTSLIALGSLALLAWSPALAATAQMKSFGGQQDDRIAARDEPGEGSDLAGWLFAAGGGGPGGDFDWCIPAGQTVVLDTSFSLITGGPHCTQTTVQQVVGGVVEVRHLRLEEGAVLRVVGPNPLLVLASGTVKIRGTLDVSGSSSMGVQTLNSTNIPEPGAPGQAGGGRGGVGSPLTTASSPKGGNGSGAFNGIDGGGRGGETGWNNTSASQLDGRRGAGGGGGTFGHNQAQTFGPVSTFGEWDQTFLGLDAEVGFPNKDPLAQGASSGPDGPVGGRTGPSPFVDADPSNDFYGFGIDPLTGAVTQGELQQPWAGAGGGAGGDASFVGSGGTWPPPFSPTGDEKGAGGAGGGGSLEILALGDIVFGPAGLILCRGGSGGGGENTLFLNRVGGGSAGGSGGHVILQTAGVIDFSNSLGPGTTPGTLRGGILATGGQGGAGKNDTGGAIVSTQGKQETPPWLDACPPGYPLSGSNACRDHVDGAGGDGGPGVVQLHTRNGFDPTNPSILLPLGLTISDVCKPLPVGADGSIRLLPRFPGYPGDSGRHSGGSSAQRWVERLRVRPGERLIGSGG